MKLSAILIDITQQLSSTTDCPRLEAELLLGHVLKLTRTELYTRSQEILTVGQCASVITLVQRRQALEPIAYILGHKEFWSLNLRVSPACLIPRPETECLIEWILQQFPIESTLKIVDLGTGSGAIALALASERPYWQITATDISTAALSLAEDNAKTLKLHSIHFQLGNWYEALQMQDYDLIISNPPYIEENDPHLAQLNHEPQSALIANDNGLADLKYLIQNAKKYLKPNGALVLEHGFNQGEAVRCLLISNGYTTIITHQDLSGQERFTSALLQETYRP